MKIAYLCEPQVGGTYTFFLRLRQGLAARGHEVICIPPLARRSFEGRRFACEPGVIYLDLPDALPSATRMLVDTLVREHVDIVTILPGCDLLTTNLVRYLPKTIRTVARIPMATRGAYRPLKAIAPYLDRVVGVCARIAEDIESVGYMRPRKVDVIWNGADIERFSPRPDARITGPLRILFSGRLEEVQKNVRILPSLAAELRRRGVDFRMRILGHGPDHAWLRQAIESGGLSDVVAMQQPVQNEELPDIYRVHDVFLLPSRFEGTPNALLEAMACGCVPVASRLEGSVDHIVQDGSSGLLCRVGDVRSFADAIASLNADRNRLAALRGAAVARVRDEFTVAHMVDGYLSLFGNLVRDPPREASPLDLASYEVPSGLGRGWRGVIPDPIKRLARTLLARCGRSI